MHKAPRPPLLLGGNCFGVGDLTDEENGPGLSVADKVEEGMVEGHLRSQRYGGYVYDPSGRGGRYRAFSSTATKALW